MHCHSCPLEWHELRFIAPPQAAPQASYLRDQQPQVLSALRPPKHHQPVMATLRQWAN